jgi:hypothetical protein
VQNELLTRRDFITLSTAAAGVAAVAFLGLPGAFAQEEAEEKGANWEELFNGEDLTGWKAEGAAKWAVEDGVLVGRQGENGAPGDLFTEKEFGDFVAVVEYKVQWPANTGIWFRYQSPEKSYQADILEYANPVAYSGTIYCPGKMFLSINKDKALEKKDDWNTMKIKAVGDHLQVWLNGEKVGDVKEDSFATGRLGFQVHAGDEFTGMSIQVRTVKVKMIEAKA